MNFKSPYKTISVEGNIGAGKSTLVNMLADDFGAKKILEEFEDNSFLPKFYTDNRRFAFPLEMSFLASRFNQLKRILIEPDLFNQKVISDYIFSKCLLFSQINLDEDEYDLYYRLFEIINQQIPAPELLIYLHSPVEKLKWNIANRGRPYEMNIETNYLLKLQNAYFSFINTNANKLRILIIDCSSIDFVKNKEDYERILEVISTDYEIGVHHVKKTSITK